MLFKRKRRQNLTLVLKLFWGFPLVDSGKKKEKRKNHPQSQKYRSSSILIRRKEEEKRAESG